MQFLAKKQLGFTLLEVMVALMILSVVAISASQASRSYINSVGNMKIRTLANYVAQNTISELHIQQTWLDSPMTKQLESQGQTWQVVITPTDDPSIKTLKHIQVSVALIQDGQVKKSIVTLESVLSKSKGNP